MGDPATAIMAYDRKPFMPEMVHQGDLIGGHDPFGIGVMRRIAVRFVAVAITAQIGGNHPVARLHKVRGDLAPDHMGLRMAVQQQARRTGARAGAVDAQIGQLDPLDIKALQERRGDHLYAVQHGVGDGRAAGFGVGGSAQIGGAQGLF